MDPRDRADAALARARARGSFVVTPEDAVSPMDAASTQQIPRVMVNALDDEQPTEGTRIRRPAGAPGTAPAMSAPPQQIPPQQASPQPATQQPQRATQQPHRPPQQQPRQQQQSGPTQPVPAASQQPVPANQQPKPVAVPEQPPTRQVEGLVPTVQQTGPQRSMLSRRLDGE
jgi:hypothetical protein